MQSAVVSAMLNFRVPTACRTKLTMTLDLMTGGIVFVACGAVFAAIRWAARRGGLRKRREIALPDLYLSFQFGVPVSLETFVEAISLVGECYRIHPGKLRADDRFDCNLSDIDSWNIEGGAEDLQTALKKRSIDLPEDGHLATVQDLIEYFAANQNRAGAGVKTSESKR